MCIINFLEKHEYQLTHTFPSAVFFLRLHFCVMSEVKIWLLAGGMEESRTEQTTNQRFKSVEGWTPWYSREKYHRNCPREQLHWNRTANVSPLDFSGVQQKRWLQYFLLSFCSVCWASSLSPTGISRGSQVCWGNSQQHGSFQTVWVSLLEVKDIRKLRTRRPWGTQVAYNEKFQFSFPTHAWSKSILLTK